MSGVVRVLMAGIGTEEAQQIDEFLAASGLDIETTAVTSLSELDRAMADGPWQVLLCGWGRPDWNGRQAMDWVRRHHPGLPVVVVSALGEEQDVVAALRAGAADFVALCRPERLGPVVRQQLLPAARTPAVPGAPSAAPDRWADSDESVYAPRLTIALDTDGLVRHVSPSCHLFLGYPAAVLRGGTLARWVHPDDAGLLGLLDSDRAGRRTADEALPVRFRHAERQWTTLEVTVAEPTNDAAPTGRVLQLRDPARERVLTLAGQQSLFQAVQQAGEAVVVTDANGVIWYVNPAYERLTGFAAEQIIGLNPRISNSGRQSPEFYRDLWATLLSGQSWRGRLTNRRRDGTLYEAEECISPVFDAAGELSHYVAVIRDITARLELEAQFRQSQKMEAVGRLASGIAHDFNNLLTLILSHAEFLQDRVEPGHPGLADVAGIRSAAERAARLTRQLLSITRQEGGDGDTVDLNEAVREMLKLLARSLGEDLELRSDLGRDLPPVALDPGRLGQVLLNLAVNARDAMPYGGTLGVATRRLPAGQRPPGQTNLPPGDYLQLVVEDTGHGMSAEVLARLFQPYFTTKPEGKGTGLGLSTVHRIVTEAGGGITVESTVGRGTRFEIYLPAAETTVARSVDTLNQPDSSHVSGTILVVEDDEAVRNLTCQILERRGYTVHSAASPEAGLAFAQGSGLQLDLVLSDIVMPGMSGPEFRLAFRAIRPETPVVFMSGYTGDVLERFDREHQLPILQKPFAARQLLDWIDQSLTKLLIEQASAASDTHSENMVSTSPSASPKP